MDRDTFIINIYCLVVEIYRTVTKHIKLRQAGFAPRLTDEEVITMEICGEYFKLHTDKDLYNYFTSHYRHFFPALADRVAFVRQAANLWQIKYLIQQRITIITGQAQDRVQPIDTLPMPVCTLTRAGRDRCYKTLADFGYCAAKKLHYYGFKLGLRISRMGMIISFPILCARPHDVEHLEVLTENFDGLVPADKGFIGKDRQQFLAATTNAIVITSQRANMLEPSTHSPALLKAASRWRRIVETVGSHLTERFAVARIRVHNIWHFQHRLIRKVLAHTMALYLNIRLGRNPLDLDGILED